MFHRSALTTLTVCATATLLLTSPAQAAEKNTAMTAPDFTLPLLTTNTSGENDNAPVSLSSYRGKVVYLDFWASWCAPCRVSLPALDTLYKDYQSQGFEVVAVNLDETTEEATAFLNDIPVSYTQLFDNDGVASTYQVRGMPTAYLIDRNGHLHSQHVGFNSNDLPQLRREIETLLANTASNETPALTAPSQLDGPQ
ncbi:MAG: TlpA disulfide reductase family protein [Pseudomonadota bacterium]|jgi:thiol-disulfide isomerase/thioredoxin|nr:TlpA disulfide reductase family protein [Pseudomonadota bacterium]